MRRGRWRPLAGAALLFPAAQAVAQVPAPAPPPVPPEASTPDDILVTGKRLPGSVIGETEPVAVLDAAAIKALGVTRLEDMLRLLKPLTTAASGADPVFLLNGRRISGFGEIQGLPPEAIERTEVLSEQDASRFGFPATVRVVNFVTKARFRALSVEQGAATTTDGGADSASLDLGSTRIAGSRRQSLTIAYARQDPLRASARGTAADTGSLFDTIGNVAGIGGGSIDPALDALAGRAVTVAPVPADAGARHTLAGYAAGANAARVTNLAPYQSIASSNSLKVDATQAVPIGGKAMASLNLTMQAQNGTGLTGLPAAVLRVAAGNPATPFTRDVLLYRYLDEVAPLRQRTSSLALHAGGTLQGSMRRWLWSVTGGYDRSRVAVAVEQGVALDGVQARIDAGGDPFRRLTPGEAANRIVNRNRTITDTLTGKATATGPAFKLPAGDAMVTFTGDYARSTSSGAVFGVGGAALDIGRTVAGASVNVDVPIASAARDVLAAIGTLSANGTIGVSTVSDYGSLVNANVGLTWTPWSPLQVTASIAASQTPPPIAALTNPVVLVPNVPFFDFVTGTSALVTVAAGGNTDLTPERRRITTVGIGLKPIRAKELRSNLDYVETRIDDQAGNLGGVTPALQAAFPDRFARDADGRLVRVDLRQVNLAFERERKVQARVTLWTQLGPEPPPPAPPAKDAPPPPPPKPRPSLYAFVAATARIEDRLQLRPGQPVLDLLAGESIDGTGGRPRFELQPNVGGAFGAVQGGIFAAYQSGTRIRSDIAASDLRFSAKTFMGLYSTIDAARIAPDAHWARRMTFQFQVQNILNDRIDVRDRNGATPYRFQKPFLDPYGRIVRLTVRKLF